MSSSAPVQSSHAGSDEPAHSDHGEHGSDLEHGDHAEHAPVVVNGISSDDEPSVEWGWHGHYPKVAQFAGFAVAIVCLILIHGNHVGKQEDIWLVAIAVVFAALSLGNILRSRTSWRR